MKAALYVGQNGYKKGEPILILKQFCMWVEEEQKNTICERTSSTFLPKLGCTYNQFNKGVNVIDIIEMTLLMPVFLTVRS